MALLAFSGCDLLRALGFGEDEPAPEQPAPPPYVGKGVPAYGADNEPSIKKKFSVDITGKAGVDAAFKELSAFIKKGGLTDSKTKGVIKLGDWIELEAGLTVAAYGEGGGGFSSDDEWNFPIKLQSDMGKMNRLIVVGINSFTQNGNNTPHVVFQFQNIPVKRRMNKDDSNAGGYPKSEMREYLTPVPGVAGSGNFLAGLKNAGVPEAVLWRPARVMATKDTPPTETINDLLWLPTEREMFGTFTTNLSATDETEGNQARLAYYGNDTPRRKAFVYYPADAQSISFYWEASAAQTGTGNFCCVNNNGRANNIIATDALGVAPAFCVQ